MSFKVKNSVKDPVFVSKRAEEILKEMANTIHDEAKRLEPPQPVKDSLAEKFRTIIAGYKRK